MGRRYEGRTDATGECREGGGAGGTVGVSEPEGCVARRGVLTVGSEGQASLLMGRRYEGGTDTAGECREGGGTHGRGRR